MIAAGAPRAGRDRVDPLAVVGAQAEPARRELHSHDSGWREGSGPIVAPAACAPRPCSRPPCGHRAGGKRCPASTPVACWRSRPTQDSTGRCAPRPWLSRPGRRVNSRPANGFASSARRTAGDCTGTAGNRGRRWRRARQGTIRRATAPRAEEITPENWCPQDPGAPGQFSSGIALLVVLTSSPSAR